MTREPGAGLDRPARIVLSGGGTAGHVAPALAVAAELRRLRPETDLLYVGTGDGIEADLAARAGIPFAAVKVSALSGRRWLQAGRALVRAATATSASAGILRGYAPDAALGTGGYVAGPVLAAAALLGVPTAIHEQNLRPGITNRTLARLVRKVFVSFPESAEHFPQRGKVVFTGYPVRPAILASTREQGATALGLDPRRQTVLIVGGSRGALTINEAVKTGVPALVRQRPDLQVIVSTGSAYHAGVTESLMAQGLTLGPQGGLIVEPYLHAMQDAYAAADLVLCRAGGTTHELTARGLPAILVPSPNVAYDQQTDNARVLVAAGAARLIADRDLTGESLAAAVLQLLAEPGALSAMAARSRSLGRPAAGDAIARLLLELAGHPAAVDR